MQSYLRIVSLTREMLAHMTCIAAQTQADADRFIQLGAKQTQIRVMGNVKFDVPLPVDLVEKGRALRQSWDTTTRPTVIAASTHANEEEIVLAAFKQLLKYYPDALLILVPRHPKRFDHVAALCEKEGYSLVRRSENKPCLATTHLFLGDSLGELFLYYAMADIAFVGGSFVSVGGHNPLEPAALGLAVITGPQVFNFTEIFSLLHKAGAAMTVKDDATLRDAWITLMSDLTRREKMGQSGQQVVRENRGAVERHINYLETQTPPR
jgi:3-deoxy-D-manno-octulosonic-acid transferase